MRLFFKLKTSIAFQRGGYLFIPEEFEFWQNSVNHLDDRIRFVKQAQSKETVRGENQWLIDRLSP